MQWFYMGFIGLAIVLGCVTTAPDRAPPQQDLLPPAVFLKEFSSQDPQGWQTTLSQMAESHPEQKNRWWADYKLGLFEQRNFPLKACEKFSKLSREESFPLKSLALIRAKENCVNFSSDLSWNRQDFPSWLKKAAISAEIAVAEREKNYPQWIDLVLEKSVLEGLPEEKLALVQTAIALAKESKDSQRLALALSRQQLLAPRFMVNPPPYQWISVAYDFKRARQFKKAQEYFQMVLRAKTTVVAQKLKALKGLAQIYKMENRTQLYHQTLFKSLRLTEPHKKNKNPQVWRIHLDSVLTLARALWTEGQAFAAEKLLKKKSIVIGQRASQSELFWLLGRIAEERQDFLQAIEWLKKAQAEPPVNPDLYEKIIWSLAWNFSKTQQWVQAEEVFNQGKSQSQNEFSRYRFLYWLAQAQKKNGQVELSASTYRTLIEQDPLGYYGLLARRELKQPLVKVAPNFKNRQQPSKIFEFVDQAVMEWLLSLGENEEARVLLDQAALQLIQLDREMSDREGEQNEASWSDLFRLYAQSGSFQSLYDWVGKMPALQRQAILEHHPELIFPQPFKSSVQSAADQVQLPSELLFAVMRQESSFNPRARSASDAFGLMQILPEVAKALAPLAQTHFRQTEDLYNPEINIPLGAYHLRQLWDRFRGQLILTVASYNAKESAVRKWVESRYKKGEDAAVFIEEIPYEETRIYIRLVIRNLIFYQILNSPQGKIEFPEWVFKLEHV